MKVSIRSATGARQIGHGSPFATEPEQPAQRHMWRQGRRTTHLGTSRHNAQREVRMPGFECDDMLYLSQPCAGEVKEGRGGCSIC